MSLSLSRVWLFILVVSSMSLLAACDDNWDVKPYYDIPYTYERTAGHGVEWTRAHLMPQKSIRNEPLMKAEDAAKTPVKVSPGKTHPDPTGKTAKTK